MLTNSAPSGPVRTARSRPNVSSSGGGTATEVTAPSAPIVISSSLLPRSAATASVPSRSPHCGPDRNAAPATASTGLPELQAAGTASG